MPIKRSAPHAPLDLEPTKPRQNARRVPVEASESTGQGYVPTAPGEKNQTETTLLAGSATLVISVWRSTIPAEIVELANTTPKRDRLHAHSVVWGPRVRHRIPHARAIPQTDGQGCGDCIQVQFPLSSIKTNILLATEPL